MKHILTTLLLTLSLSSFADSLYLGGWSKHFIVKGNGEITLNESHNIIAIEHKNWIAGYFKNSYDDDSALVARKYHIMSSNTWELDIAVGGVYGYRTCKMKDGYPESADKRWCPAIVPEITYTKYRVQPSIMVMSGALVLTFKIDY